MAEYIKRDTAIRAVMAAKWVDGSDGAMAMEIVASPPAADVAPVVHGRWDEYTRSRYIGCDEYGDPRYVDGVVYYCSNPRCRRRTVIKERYCPSCGAKMDEGLKNI